MYEEIDRLSPYLYQPMLQTGAGVLRRSGCETGRPSPPFAPRTEITINTHDFGVRRPRICA